VPAFDSTVYQARISSVDAAVSSHDKGKAFEDLAEYLFGTLNGVEVAGRDVRMGAEEIDLVLWNAQVEDVLRPWDGVIAVECKNWSSPVGASQLDSFISKMGRRSLKTGIFIAAHGVTGQYVTGDAALPGGAREVIRAALQEGIRVITITMDDLRAITCCDDLRVLIKRRYCGLYVQKVF
jgi:hypothetical protein